MIDAAFLAAMPDGATLINTARGIIVDQDRARCGLVTGRLSAILDVTEPEVLSADHPLYDLPTSWLTPHVAGALGSEISRMGRLVLDEVQRILARRPLEHTEQ